MGIVPPIHRCLESVPSFFPFFAIDFADVLVHAAEIENDRLRHIRLHERVNELPDPNYATLKFLMGHLDKYVHLPRSLLTSVLILDLCRLQSRSTRIFESNVGFKPRDRLWSESPLSTSTPPRTPLPSSPHLIERGFLFRLEWLCDTSKRSGRRSTAFVFACRYPVQVQMRRDDPRSLQRDLCRIEPVFLLVDPDRYRRNAGRSLRAFRHFPRSLFTAVLILPVISTLTACL